MNTDFPQMLKYMILIKVSMFTSLLSSLEVLQIKFNKKFYLVSTQS